MVEKTGEQMDKLTFDDIIKGKDVSSPSSNLRRRRPRERSSGVTSRVKRRRATQVRSAQGSRAA